MIIRWSRVILEGTIMKRAIVYVTTLFILALVACSAEVGTVEVQQLVEATATLVPPTNTPNPPTATPVTPTLNPLSDVLTQQALTAQATTPSPTDSSESPHIETDSIDFEGRLRKHIVFLPNNYTGTTNFPLVIYLHSYGWTARRGMNYTSLNQVADTYDFIVVYPSASTNWNSGIGESPVWRTPDVNDVGYINALIDTLSNNYSIDLERIYATGYSNGGFMAFKLACQLSHRIAAIASVSGVMSTNVAANCNPLRTMPVLQIHGSDDEWVPINGTTKWQSVDQTLTYWIDFNNCVKADTAILQDTDSTDGSTVEKISYTNCTDNSNVIQYEVINGGHTWPGAGNPGYPAGRTNQDFDAGVEIWNFFKDYKLILASIESNENDGSP